MNNHRHGDYAAKRSAAGTQNTELYILRAWRLRSEAKCRQDAEHRIIHIASMATTQRSEVPPGRRTQSCTYCEHGETVDAQH